MRYIEPAKPCQDPPIDKKYTDDEIKELIEIELNGKV